MYSVFAIGRLLKNWNDMKELLKHKWVFVVKERSIINYEQFRTIRKFYFFFRHFKNMRGRTKSNYQNLNFKRYKISDMFIQKLMGMPLCIVTAHL